MKRAISKVFLNLAFLFGTRNISCLRGGLILNVHIYLCNQQEFLFVKNKNQTRGYCLICSKKVISIPYPANGVTKTDEFSENHIADFATKVRDFATKVRMFILAGLLYII